MSRATAVAGLGTSMFVFAVLAALLCLFGGALSLDAIAAGALTDLVPLLSALWTSACLIACAVGCGIAAANTLREPSPALVRGHALALWAIAIAWASAYALLLSSLAGSLYFIAR